MPNAHAVLSPSAAHRWLHCPASVLASAGVPDRPSSYAEEGTTAHVAAEHAAAEQFGLSPGSPGTTYDDDMIDCAQQYAAALAAFAADMGPLTQVRLEQTVQTGVPECWGTIDAVLVSLNVLHVVDFKYGKGVIVSAEGNPQLRLYAVGALDAYDLLSTVTEVRMTIFQPRVDNVSTVTMSADELRAWRDTVIPQAALALDPDRAEFHPSEEACRFCPIAGECKPRMAYLTQRDFGTDPNLLSPTEMAEALALVPQIRSWLTALEGRALERAHDEGIPGWKIVLSGQRRQIVDDALAIGRLRAAGFTLKRITRTTPLPLGELEKIIGKDRLPELLGDALTKTRGKESLVTDDDPRPGTSPEAEAAKDFS